MRKNVMKLTAGVLSTAVLAGMFATGIPTKIAAATEHWNDASRGNLQTGATGKRTGLLIAVSMNMYR